MRTSSALCAALLSALCLSPTINVHAQAFQNMGGTGVSTTAPSTLSAITKAMDPSPIRTPSSKTPEQVFDRARQIGDPESGNVPFHMKANFIASGDAEFTGDGTYEEWWQSKNVWRKEATFGKYRYVAIQNGETLVAYSASDYVPLRVVQAISFPFVNLELPAAKQAKWKVFSITDHDSALDEVSRRGPCVKGMKHFVCTDAYDFSSNGVLKSVSAGDSLAVFSDLQPFGKLLLPRHILRTLRDNPVLVTDITAWEPLPDHLDQKLFDPKSASALPAVAPLLSFYGKTPKGFSRPVLVREELAEYPKSARRYYKAVPVVMAMQIDANGSIREPYALQLNDANLEDEVVKTISKWIFKPATLNGRPVQSSFELVYMFSVF